jgi:hypothetical protein
MYEIVVEFIEAWDGPFTIMALCDAYNEKTKTIRWRWHTVFANAVHDMARHGLVRCIRRGNRRCFSWRKVDVPTADKHSDADLS